VNISCISPKLKKSSSDWLNSGKAVTQHFSEKMWFSCFRVLPGNAEALVKWGWKYKVPFDFLRFWQHFWQKLSISVDAGRSDSKPKQCRFFETQCIEVIVRMTLIMKAFRGTARVGRVDWSPTSLIAVVLLLQLRFYVTPLLRSHHPLPLFFLSSHCQTRSQSAGAL